MRVKGTGVELGCNEEFVAYRQHGHIRMVAALQLFELPMIRIPLGFKRLLNLDFLLGQAGLFTHARNGWGGGIWFVSSLRSSLTINFSSLLCLGFPLWAWLLLLFYSG